MTKFKRISAMAIAVTMMVSVLSAGASEAQLNNSLNDTVVSVANENQSFTSLIFDEISEEPEKSTIENPGDYGISPMWLKSDHQSMLDSIINNCSNQEFKKYKETIKLGAYEADYKLKDLCKSLHGKSNYVVTLKLLWKFAKRLGANESLATAKNTALSSIPENLRTKDLKNTAENIVTYIKNNHSKYSQSEKKCYIIGLTCHLIADVYAHRMIVPVNTITGTSSTSTNTTFGKSDFKNDASIKTFDNAILKKIAKEPSDYMENKYKVWQYFAQTVKLGVMEFRDIKYYTKSTVPSSKYADNKSFCKNRYNNAKDSCEYFIENFKDGFDESTFVPYYGLKLNNYYGYIVELGINTSYFYREQWESISTMSLV